MVLTFDDGPWPTTTSVLKALADQCVRATFFIIGKHATYYPEILKQVHEQGHTIGSHTWSHATLVTKLDDIPVQSGQRKLFAKRLITFDQAKDEIEKGVSAVVASAGVPTAPFFRFPSLIHPPELLKYLGERNVAAFSTDIDSFDFTTRKPERVVENVIAKLKTRGKGMVLLHDFQPHTAAAIPELLNQLKANGFKIVHMRPKYPIKTIASYDELLKKELATKSPTIGGDRPTSSVVRDVSE